MRFLSPTASSVLTHQRGIMDGAAPITLNPHFGVDLHTFNGIRRLGEPCKGIEVISLGTHNQLKNKGFTFSHIDFFTYSTFVVHRKPVPMWASVELLAAGPLSLADHQ